MKSKTALALIGFIITSFTYAQDTTQLKRFPYKLTVAVDKKTEYTEEINATPYVLPDNTVQLYPGETVYIEVEQVNGVIKSMKAVKSISDSTKTLITQLCANGRKEGSQNDDANSGKSI